MNNHRHAWFVWLCLASSCVVGTDDIADESQVDLVGSSCSVTPDPVALGERFTVTAAGLRKLADVTVELADSVASSSWSATTDAEGRLSFARQASVAGPARVAIRHQGRLKATCGFTVDDASAPSISLAVEGAPNLPYHGTQAKVTVGFVSTPVRVDLSRDGNPAFASWPGGSFFTLAADGRSLTGSWCISASCWGFVEGTHVLDVVGTFSDGQTAAASVTVHVADAADSTPPTVPANLTATVTSASQLRLAWTASTDQVGVTGYRVERCTGAGCAAFAEIGTATTSTFASAGLAAATTYSYRVRAYDAAGNLSGYSNMASATTPSPVTTPYVMRVETVATDGRTGAGDNGWGGHQVRYTTHADGTEHALYIRGGLNDTTRNWRLVKRAANGGWSEAATNQTHHEAHIVRTSDDRVHVVAFPNNVATIYSSPSFAPVTIRPGEMPKVLTYVGVGIGADDTIVIKSYTDPCSPCTAATTAVWASGAWNGASWAFHPVVQQYVGDRYAYDYVLPGAFGNPDEFVHVANRDVLKAVAGLPNLTASYVWDGMRAFVSGITNTTAWRQFDVMPRRTPPSNTTTSAAFMYFMDVFADSSHRLITLHRVTDPAGPSGLYLTVDDAAGHQLYQGIPSYQGGYPRIFEDSKGRLWLLALQSGTPHVRLYRVNSDFTLGAYTDLSSAFANRPIGERARLAVPRGGNLVDNTITGYYPYGATITAFKIRLPD